MAIIARLQTPEDNAGIREDMDVITSSDAVYVGEKTLTERLSELATTVAGSGIIVSEVKPAGPCFWADVIKTE